jgi:NAD(P)-dependent dehydrogenase (short-subunit alcohol dehydrogenase family)
MSGERTESAQRLSGQVAIVTGGGRGIGRAIALTLADAGAAVAVVARSGGEVDETARLIAERGGRAIALAADVASRADVERVAAETEARLGPVDILINNAGVSGPRTPLPETDPDEWWRTIEVNLRGPMLCAHAVLPGMIRRAHGFIINIGSYAGIRPDTGGYGAYAVSKAALVRFGDSLAATCGGQGVQVFTLSPGLVHTAMADAVDVFKQIPESEWTPVAQVAATVLRLAAGDARQLNGRFFHVQDDLDELLRKTEHIEREGLYTLRLSNLDGLVE